jgi:hemerythrin
MSLIEWNNALSVGVGSIDNQHKELVYMLDTLSDAMQAGHGEDVLGKIFDDLIAYTVRHFGHEEALMKSHSYPDAANHEQEHHDLRTQAIALQDKANAGSIVVTIDTLNFLRNWLVHHIQETDKAFGAYLNTQGVH